MTSFNFVTTILVGDPAAPRPKDLTLVVGSQVLLEFDVFYTNDGGCSMTPVVSDSGTTFEIILPDLGPSGTIIAIPAVVGTNRYVVPFVPPGLGVFVGQTLTAYGKMIQDTAIVLSNAFQVTFLSEPTD